jgi:hypothetical protein
MLAADIRGGGERVRGGGCLLVEVSTHLTEQMDLLAEGHQLLEQVLIQQVQLRLDALIVERAVALHPRSRHPEVFCAHSEAVPILEVEIDQRVECPFKVVDVSDIGRAFLF